MKLDPALQQILESYPNLPETLTPDLIVKIREARLQTILDIEERPFVHAVENRLIPGPNGDIPIRIYTPKSVEERLPAIVFFHGGGWTLGNLESHDVACRQLTNASRCKVIAVDYRLAPENRFPKGLKDCSAAVQWVFNHAKELQVDVNRIAVGGDSAGGNLSAAVTLLFKNCGGPSIWRQILIYPATDALRSIQQSPYESIRENAQAPLLTSSVTKSFWDHYIKTEEDASNIYASPIRAQDLSGLPKTFVITAQYDPIRDEGEAYANRLQESGVPVQLTRYSGLVHGFLTLPLPINEQVFQSIAKFLNE